MPRNGSGARRKPGPGNLKLGGGQLNSVDAVLERAEQDRAAVAPPARGLSYPWEDDFYEHRDAPPIPVQRIRPPVLPGTTPNTDSARQRKAKRTQREHPGTKNGGRKAR